MDIIEQQKDILNLEIRKLLSLIDMIEGENNEYPNYEKNTLDIEKYLQQQIELIKIANEKMIKIFKD